MGTVHRGVWGKALTRILADKEPRILADRSGAALPLSIGLAVYFLA